jgi:hypothetical protein
MAHYSTEDLVKRNAIIKSQLHFSNILDSTIINALIHIFDKEYNEYVNQNHKISKYIRDERNARGLDDSNITIESEFYGHTNNNPKINVNKNDNSTLHLLVKKNNEDLIHLSIHLSVKALEPVHAGIIYIAKNIYKKKNIRSKKIKSYALISVKKTNGKSKSLTFSIDEGYTSPTVKNYEKYDPMIQQEMDVIVFVLNRIFNEDDELYVGNLFFPIHRKAERTLRNMNLKTRILRRKNNGIMMIPNFNNEPVIIFSNNINVCTPLTVCYIITILSLL